MPDPLLAEAVHIMAETVFGPTLTLSGGKVIPTRWVGEQHVKEDLGFIPSFADWMRAIRRQHEATTADASPAPGGSCEQTAGERP